MSNSPKDLQCLSRGGCMRPEECRSQGMCMRPAVGMDAPLASNPNHCADCCCARSWKALGFTAYTGLSIPEHIEQMRKALEHIAAGRGPFSVDQLTFASNVIETMKTTAQKALAGTYEPE